MPVDISNLGRVSGRSSPSKRPPSSPSPRSNSHYLAAEEELIPQAVPEPNMSMSHGETQESDNNSLSDRLVRLTFSFWTKLYTVIERWFIAASQGWHQSWWSILSEVMAEPNSHRSIASQQRGHFQPSPCPDWCISLMDDIPIHQAQGDQDFHDPDPSIGSAYSNGTFEPEMGSHTTSE